MKILFFSKILQIQISLGMLKKISFCNYIHCDFVDWNFFLCTILHDQAYEYFLYPFYDTCVWFIGSSYIGNLKINFKVAILEIQLDSHVKRSETWFIRSNLKYISDSREIRSLNFKLWSFYFPWNLPMCRTCNLKWGLCWIE